MSDAEDIASKAFWCICADCKHTWADAVIWRRRMTGPVNRTPPDWRGNRE